MNKMKFLLTAMFCLALFSKVSAQFGGKLPIINDLTVVWDGAPGYRSNSTFTVKLDKNNTTYTHKFYGPGVFAPPMVMGSNIIGAIQFSINDGSIMYANTTYTNYYQNGVPIGGGENQVYIDTWNDKNWYLYLSKTTPTVWHFRIGN